jgi:hypothetical protein
MLSTLAEETPSQEAWQEEPRGRSREHRSSSSTPIQSPSSEVLDDLNDVTALPEQVDSGTETPVFSSAECAAILQRFKHFAGSPSPKSDLREEAQRYLQDARIALLDKVGYLHPLFFRTKMDGSLQAEESVSSPEENWKGDESDDETSLAKAQVRTFENEQSDPARELPSVEELSSEPSDEELQLPDWDWDF